jgi:hypothetical protein
MTARARLWLDLALFGALLVGYNPAWTHIAVHEWLCVVAVVPLLLHIIINWDQTLRILSRFAEIVRATPKVNIVVDAALFVSAVTVMLSGLLISQYVAKAVGITIRPTSLWVTAHRWSADATMLLLLVHFALHWRWVVKTAGKLGRTGASVEDDPLLAIRLATRRLDAAPRGERYATVPATTDSHYRP